MLNFLLLPLAMVAAFYTFKITPFNYKSNSNDTLATGKGYLNDA